MLRPDTIRAHHESSSTQRPGNLVRPIRQGHRDARRVDDVREGAGARHADLLEPPAGGVRGEREDQAVSFVRRSPGHSYPPPRPRSGDPSHPLRQAK